jgi:hypothetical protein
MAAILAATGAVVAVPARSEPVGSVAQVSDIPGDVTFDADDPRVAFGADGRGLAVYIGEGTGGETEVYGRPVGASGGPTGPQRRLTHVGTDGDVTAQARVPDVVYNSRAGEFLVVSENALANDQQVGVQRVALDGAPIGSSVTISETGGAGPGTDGDNARPQVAYDPVRDEYLVAWIDGRDVLGNEVRAQRLTASLAQVGPPDFFVSEVGGANTNAGRIDAGYGGGTFLVTWSDFVGGNDEEIIGRRVNSGGGVLGGEVQLSRQGPIDDDELESNRPAVAYNAVSNQFLVVWEGDLPNGVGSGEHEIFGQRVSAAGAQVGSDLRITHQGTDGDLESDAEEPAIAAGPGNGEYLVAWQGKGPSQEVEAYGQRLSSAGAAVGAVAPRFSDQGPAGDPAFYADTAATAFNPAAHEFLVVWRGTRSLDVATTDSEDEIFARRATSPFTPPATTPIPKPTAVPIAPSAPRPAAPLRATDVIRFPATRRCGPRRTLKIRLRRPGGVKLVSARVVINGKRRPLVRGRGLAKPIVLKRLPQGRLKVKVTVTTSKGKKLTVTRRYRSCKR